MSDYYWRLLICPQLNQQKVGGLNCEMNYSMEFTTMYSKVNWEKMSELTDFDCNYILIYRSPFLKSLQ